MQRRVGSWRGHPLALGLAPDAVAPSPAAAAAADAAGVAAVPERALPPPHGRHAASGRDALQRRDETRDAWAAW